MKKCIYCKREIPEDSVIDFCTPCGRGVWGDKMLQAIINSMEKARDEGNLDQGSVSNSLEKTNVGDFYSKKAF